jgi:hypothetical protein
MNTASTHAESRFPTRRAYVLKLRGDATSDALAGRLENLATGSRLEFGSASELLEAIARELQAGSAEPAD